jgi:hypothetical protein
MSADIRQDNANNTGDQYLRFIYDIYMKHRDAFECSTNIDRVMLNTDKSHVETYDEFLSRYIMHIAHETNIASRVAIRSHSPLLTMKHVHQPIDYQLTVQTLDKTLNDIVERI